MSERLAVLVIGMTGTEALGKVMNLSSLVKTQGVYVLLKLGREGPVRMQT